MKIKILYIVHSNCTGGALLSLHRLVEKLDRNRYEPIMVFIHDTPEILEMFSSLGAESIYWPKISIFPHTTGGWYSFLNPIDMIGFVQSIAAFRSSIHSTEDLIHTINPDIVHLNSLVLIPSAIATKRTNKKLVWHVRESVHSGFLGIRKKWIEGTILSLADETIYICRHNQLELVGDSEKGVIVHNPVDLSQFDLNIDRSTVRKELGLKQSSKVVLFFGGMSRIKGAFVLLHALRKTKRLVPDLEVIITAAITPQSNNLMVRSARALLPLIGSGTPRQRFHELLASENLQDCVYLLPFSTTPAELMAAADLIVSPHTEPHFSMPVVEAGAMGKPVVASQIGGIEEAVVHGETGLLVPPNDPDALAEAIACVLTDPLLARRLGKGGYRQTIENYSAKKHIYEIQNIYDRLFEER